ncbi:class I SAM-dependent methyltransferase [Aquincola sp. S2]|uniref:Class I SAM-dependent methyltransferase n=2 Tax=Pseudaquabacterium terrae TaxID=2732868 RepID=A0ABX2ELS9_9BURK|nr:class I SAM-dependent methyltransferase [Aquabacterium terrae]
MAVYYARRAAEYERIYHKPERQAELRALETTLPAFFSGRRVLEIACGTGWWTVHGARDAAHWLATDLNPETMAIARAKPLPASVELRSLDAYTLAGLDGERFDAAFAGHWWSHVPRARLPAWLDTLHARLEPGARIVMLDNAYAEGSSTPITRRDAEGNSYQQRTLSDGSIHEVLKNFPERDEAIAQLGARARDPQWSATRHYWRLAYTLA